MAGDEHARVEWAKARGPSPLARVVSCGVSGVELRIRGLGPVPNTRAALAKAGLTLDAMDLIEVKEAFTA